MKRISLYLILYIASLCSASAAGYKSTLVKSLAMAIGYCPSDTVSVGYHDAATSYRKPIVVCYDSDHTLTNIGLKLFHPDIRASYSPIVTDFLERYFLQLCTWKDKSTLSQKLHDDKVMFTAGSVSAISSITPETAFCISRTDSKYYEATWSVNSKPILSVAFPIQYELLLGMPQAEIEQGLADEIFHTMPATFAPPQPQSLTETVEGIYQSAPVANYMIETLTTCTYYTKDNDGSYSLIVDAAHPDMSATNIFHDASAFDNNIVIDQELYGFKKKHFVASLQQLVAMFKMQGFTVYTSVESTSADARRVLIVAESKDLGYNHMLSVVVPDSFISNPKAEFTARLFAYIPTHNLKNLYKQSTSTHKKINVR